jgi:hypothetical protein
MTCSPARLSSEPVGSSANTTAGSITIARATATRWAWPPDISPGRRSANPSRPRRGNQVAARASAAARDSPLRSSGNATFSTAVSSGTSWPNWKTKPNEVRRSRLRSPSRMRSTRRPSNVTAPSSGVRIPARQCRRVDLPEPLGPITATISPGSSSKSMPRSASVWPNRFRRPSAVRIGAGVRAWAWMTVAARVATVMVSPIDRGSACEGRPRGRP